MAKKKSYFRLILISSLVFAVFFCIGAGATKVAQNAIKAADRSGIEDQISDLDDGERTNILVLGIDARPGEKKSRSDTIMLVSIDPKLDKAAIVSIPRDTRVEIKGSPLPKICTANYVGGPEYAVETVENFMGITIDYYIEMDFNGFANIIDTLGGVDINVPCRMYKPSEGIDLYPGNQRLNGKQALAFVRYRNYAYGDIQRTTQQQEFIRALADEVLQAKTIIKLPKLVQQLNEYMTTNMKTSDMLKLASWAPGFNSDSIITQTLPGYFFDVYDDEGNMEQSFWIADQSSITSLLDNMFAGKTVAAIQASPYPVYRPEPKDNESEADVNKDDNDSDEEPINIDENTTGKDTNQTGEDDDRNEERSNLPSPGHLPGELDMPGSKV